MCNEQEFINYKNMEKMNEKQTYIDTKIVSIKKSIEKYGYDKISTCNAFSYGWSKEDYLYMDSVANELKSQGFSVRVSVSHGVTDYYITK